MSDHRNSTAMLGASSVEMELQSIIQAYRELENDICRAHNMAVIVDDALDAKFVKRGDRWIADLSKENLEAITFAWKELRSLTAQVSDHFYSIESGEA